MWSTSTELFLRYLQHSIVSLLKRLNMTFIITKTFPFACLVLGQRLYLLLVHYNNGESHLFGPGAHHCSNGLPTSLL